MTTRGTLSIINQQDFFNRIQNSAAASCFRMWDAGSQTWKNRWMSRFPYWKSYLKYIHSDPKKESGFHQIHDSESLIFS